MVHVSRYDESERIIKSEVYFITPGIQNGLNCVKLTCVHCATHAQ